MNSPLDEFTLEPPDDSLFADAPVMLLDGRPILLADLQDVCRAAREQA